MRLSQWRLSTVLVAVFLLSGCYTQVATYEENDNATSDGYSYRDSDTLTNKESGTTIINNYFGDDAYRSWRFRMSFRYYYPSRHIWWTDSWYYDPWWCDDWWYPCYYPAYTIIYPVPYWYPPYWWYYRYPYYGYGYYYNYPSYAYGVPAVPGRRRSTGSSRGDDGGSRSRTPTPASASTIQDEGIRSRVPAEAVETSKDPQRSREKAPAVQPGRSGGVRSRVPAEAVPDEASKTSRRTRQETPWWDRMKDESADAGKRARSVSPGSSTRRGGTEARPAEGRRGGQRSTDQSRPRQVRPQEPKRDSEGRSVEQQRGRQAPQYTPPTRREAPSYNPPPPREGRSGESRGSSGGSQGRKRD